MERMLLITSQCEMYQRHERQGNKSKEKKAWFIKSGLNHLLQPGKALLEQLNKILDVPDDRLPDSFFLINATDWPGQVGSIVCVRGCVCVGGCMHVGVDGCVHWWVDV